jgi:hypothetical protein
MLLAKKALWLDAAPATVSIATMTLSGLTPRAGMPSRSRWGARVTQIGENLARAIRQADHHGPGKGALALRGQHPGIDGILAMACNSSSELRRRIE